MNDQQRLTTALAACRAVLFARNNAERFKGKYNLTDLQTAERLAAEALQGMPQQTTLPTRRRVR